MESSDVGIGDQILASQYNNLRSDGLAWITGASTETTISSGVITIIAGKTLYTVDTEGNAATDDLDSISGGAEGSILILVAENAERVVTIKDSVDILLSDDEDLDLDATNVVIVLIKLSSGSWLELSRSSILSTSLPAGVIGLFDDDCPVGWTRFSALDAKYPRGASSYGGTGGAATHIHTVATVPAHTHAVGTLAGASDGSHTHTFSAGTEWEIAIIIIMNAISGTYWQSTTWNGNHLHSLGGTVANGGTVGAETDSADNLPLYLNMIFCQKD